MTDASPPNPFEVLGLDPTARDVEIRRHYLRRLHKVDPDANPEGFLRLRRARHEALQRAPGNRTAVGDPAQDQPREPADEILLTSMDCALGRGDCPEGLEIASMGSWHNALIREDELVVEATIRLACASVWAAPDVYEQVWLQHADVLRAFGAEHCSGVLPFMHDFASELSAWSVLRTPAPWLTAFLEAGVVPSPRHRRLARTLRTALTERPRTVLAELDRMQGYLPSLIAFVGHVARELPYELGNMLAIEDRAEDHEPELTRAFPMVRVAVLAPAATAVAGAVRAIRAPVLAGVGTVALFSWYLHDEWYRVAVRPRLLRVCLRTGVAPFDLGAWARTQPLWSRPRPFGRRLADDGVLQAAYDLQRFARAAS